MYRRERRSASKWPMSTKLSTYTIRVREICQARGLFCLSRTRSPTYPGPRISSPSRRPPLLPSARARASERSPLLSSRSTNSRAWAPTFCRPTTGPDRRVLNDFKPVSMRVHARNRVLNWPRWNKVYGLCPLNGISVRSLARNWELGMIASIRHSIRMDAPILATCRCSFSRSIYFDILMSISTNTESDIDALWQLLISNILAVENYL